MFLFAQKFEGDSGVCTQTTEQKVKKKSFYAKSVRISFVSVNLNFLHVPQRKLNLSFEV